MTKKPKTKPNPNDCNQKFKGKIGSLFSDPRHTAGVSEAYHIGVVKMLEEFRNSEDRAYTFLPFLNNHERAAVHLHCLRMGLVSKSSGKGKERRLSVHKSENSVISFSSRFSGKSENRKNSNHVGKKKFRNQESPVITFSEESKRVLMDLFIHYPPGDDDVGKQNFNEASVRTPKSQGKLGDIFHKPGMSKSEIAKMVESQKLKEISNQRARLPIASFRNVITSTVAEHQVVLLHGETGCGKTTQVPQYLLDDMWAKGEDCKIICTQPRRISAMSVAERISYERGEKIGESVGYKVRLNSSGGRHSSIIFCTNGILMRLLVSRGSNAFASGATELSQFTHIIVDEIHERDRFSDFMLAIFRDVLPNNPHLRLVLMSATIDAERFSQYFGGCPIIRVPGFTHPVKTFYLEEVLSILKTPNKNHLNSTSLSHLIEDFSLNEKSRVELDKALEIAIFSDEEFDRLLELISSIGTTKVLNYQHSSSGVTPLMVFAAKGRIGYIYTLLSLGADCHLRAHDGSTALDWAVRENQPEAEYIIKEHMMGNSLSSVEEQSLLEKYMSKVNPEIIDVVLIENLLRKICMESQKGAILVFLPGWDDINKTQDALFATPFFNDPSKFQILLLHSMVPAAEQKKVFKKPPKGCRKIILSTNIAETAVTIDDVVYVLNSGRMKEKSYDPYSNVSTLQSSWTSQASAKQREGRAGRCQPGFCYHLYSKLRAVSLPEFQEPEIKRMPIEELCLQVKILDPNCRIEKFLKKTLDPPVSESIKNAITVLQEIGALTHDEQLTELGKKLGSLPVHPLISKMLFFAILLNCLDPALTLACAIDFKDPFNLPMEPRDRNKAHAARVELASLYGGFSDQLAIIAAFDCWKSAPEKYYRTKFCSKYFLSSTTMNMLSAMRIQLKNELIKAGCIPDDVSNLSRNARDPGILRALLVAGFYPMVGRLHPHTKGRFLVETANGDKVLLHSHSLASKLHNKDTDELPLLVYDEVTRGDGGLHTRNCTIIGPLPLLLLATEIVVVPGSSKDNGDADDSTSDEDKMDILDETDKQGDKVMSSPENAVTVIVDRWLSFKCTALEVAQIYCLRERLSAAIHFKVTKPLELLPPTLGASVFAVACVLAYDGMKGMPIRPESVESLTAMVNNAEIGNSSAKKKKAKAAPDPESVESLTSMVNDAEIGNSSAKKNKEKAAPNPESVESLTSIVNNAEIGNSSAKKNWFKTGLLWELKHLRDDALHASMLPVLGPRRPPHQKPMPMPSDGVGAGAPAAVAGHGSGGESGEPAAVAGHGLGGESGESAAVAVAGHGSGGESEAPASAAVHGSGEASGAPAAAAVHGSGEESGAPAVAVHGSGGESGAPAAVAVQGSDGESGAPAAVAGHVSGEESRAQSSSKARRKRRRKKAAMNDTSRE